MEGVIIYIMHVNEGKLEECFVSQEIKKKVELYCN